MNILTSVGDFASLIFLAAAGWNALVAAVHPSSRAARIFWALVCIVGSIACVLQATGQVITLFCATIWAVGCLILPQPQSWQIADTGGMPLKRSTRALFAVRASHLVRMLLLIIVIGVVLLLSADRGGRDAAGDLGRASSNSSLIP